MYKKIYSKLYYDNTLKSSYYTIIGPQLFFSNLLKNGYAIISLTQCADDTLSYLENTCNSGPLNINNDIYTEQNEGKCSSNSNCTSFSNCNSNCDIFWMTQYGPSSDYIYMINVFKNILNGKILGINVKYNEIGLFGWSVGAQMVSRCINEFTNMTDTRKIYFPNFYWPNNINFAIMGAGGSLYCYDKNTSCNNDRPQIQEGCCPYQPIFPTSQNQIKILEPIYDKYPILYKNHPLVLGFQSYDDSFADPYATRSYNNILNYNLKLYNIEELAPEPLMVEGNIHGMTNYYQVNGCINFALLHFKK